MANSGAWTPPANDLTVTPAQSSEPIATIVGKPAWSPPENDLTISNHPVTDEIGDALAAIPRAAMRGIGGLGDILGATREKGDMTIDALNRPAGTPPEQPHPVLRMAAEEIADRLGVPKVPNTALGQITAGGVEGAIGGLPFGPAGAFAGGFSGASSEAAKQAGAGPVGQFAAGMIPISPSIIGGATRNLIRGSSDLAPNLRMFEQAGVNPELAQLRATNVNAPGNPPEFAFGGGNTGAMPKLPGGSKILENRAAQPRQVQATVEQTAQASAPNLNLHEAIPGTGGQAINQGVHESGLKDAANEADAYQKVTEALPFGEDTPMSAPKFGELRGSRTFHPTGDPELDAAITSAQGRKINEAAAAHEAKAPNNLVTGYTNDNGIHSVTSANGETQAKETAAGDMEVFHTSTNPESRGKGEGVARMAQMADVAHGKDMDLVSGTTVTKDQQAVYDSLEKRGYTIERNPNATVNPETGSLISDSNFTPVYKVKKPLYQPTGTNEAQPWTYGELKSLRTKVGQSIDYGLTPADPGKNAELKQIYGALTDDINTGLQKYPGASQARTEANALYQTNSRKREVLSGIVDKVGGPEAVFKAAMSGSKDGATKLSTVMGALNPEQQGVLRAVQLNRLGHPSGALDRPWDENTYLNNYQNLDPSAKNVLYGPQGSPVRDKLDAVAGVLQLRKNLGYSQSGLEAAVERGSSRAHSGILGYAVGAATVAMEPLLAHIATNHPLVTAAGVTAGVTSAVMNPIMSRVLTSPTKLRWLAKASTVPQSAMPVLMAQLNRMGSDGDDIKQVVQGDLR